jgi:hypothetical protein
MNQQRHSIAPQTRQNEMKSVIPRFLEFYTPS